MSDFRRFLAALALAAIYRFSWKRPWTLAKPFIAVLFSILPHRKVSNEVFEKRMECCRNCPAYYFPLSSCGSPLADDPAIGCHCFLPVKSKSPDVVCWLDNEYGEHAPACSWKGQGVV